MLLSSTFELFDLNTIHLGHRLDAQIIKYVQVETWIDCLTTCLLHKNISCRSVNFRKTCCEENGNCELLETIDAAGSINLKQNESFDHYILVTVSSTRSYIKRYIY